MYLKKNKKSLIGQASIEYICVSAVILLALLAVSLLGRVSLAFESEVDQVVAYFNG